MAKLPKLREHARAEAAPLETVPVHGGPDTAVTLRTHAERLQRAFALDGAPVLGVSMFAAQDDVGPASLSGLRAGRLSTYRVVHLVSIGRLMDAGFNLLPTFARPHMTVLMDSPDQASTLLDLLGALQPNPGYGEKRHRRGGGSPR